MSGNHTPTPWAIGRYGDVLNTSDGDVVRAKGFALTNSDEAVANSAFIVTAVNSYASSQAEIERLREALRNIAQGNLGDDPWQANYAKIRKTAIEALEPKP